MLMDPRVRAAASTASQMAPAVPRSPFQIRTSSTYIVVSESGGISPKPSARTGASRASASPAGWAVPVTNRAS
jgi:hypothetical protein